MTADPPSRSDGPDPGLDVDAAFAEIVAHWGPPTPGVLDDGTGPGRAPEPPPTRPAVDRSPVDRSPVENHPVDRGPVQPGPGSPTPPGSPWDDSLNSAASWEDEGHFVPPVPPPLPVIEPRRRMAWIALLGAPVVGLLLLLLQVAIPSWVSSFLVCAFVGGFCYLVATMGQPPRGGWSGDDGAVL